MRSFVALGSLLAVLVALTVTIAPRRHRRPPPPPTEEDDAVVKTPAPPAPPAPPRRPPRPPVQASGPAHLFGRVVAAAGEALDADDLVVSADDGARTIRARVSPEGAFDLHVPPGQYTLVASAGAWVGLAAGIPARAGGEREVTIALGPSASIEGTLRAPADAAVTFRISPTGRDAWDEGALVGDSGFLAEELVPGRAYDLSFSGPGLRTATLRSLTAPASGLVVQLDALPTLRGAIGFPRGERCPIARVGLYGANGLPANDEDLAGDEGDQGDEDEQRRGPVGDVDSACRFQLPVPEGASQMVLLAVGDGWHLEQELSIPPAGDPDPVCLNPPCRADPVDEDDPIAVPGEPPPNGGGISESYSVR